MLMQQGPWPPGPEFFLLRNCFCFTSFPPSPCPNSLRAFQLDGNLELILDSFRLTFMGMSHLSARGPSSMAFQHLQDAFNLKDFSSDFIQLHQLNSHITMGCFPKFITCVLIPILPWVVSQSSLLASFVLLGYWLWPNL